jgi:hypothetical protein
MSTRNHRSQMNRGLVIIGLIGLVIWLVLAWLVQPL